MQDMDEQIQSSEDHAIPGSSTIHPTSIELDLATVTERLSALHYVASPDRRSKPRPNTANSPPVLSTSPSSSSRRCLYEEFQQLDITKQEKQQGWKHLPVDIVSIIVKDLTLSDIRAARGVCRDWKHTISVSLPLLRPRALKAVKIAECFSSIQHLDLKKCTKLTDCDLQKLGSLGKTLVSLSLEGCEDITDECADELRSLYRLKTLNLRNCVKLSDETLCMLCGLTPDVYNNRTTSPRRLGTPTPSPRRHSTSTSTITAIAAASNTYPSQLQSLDVSGCIWITQHGLNAVPSSFPGLTSLCLGGCNRASTVVDAMLIPVGQCKELRILDLSGCTHITNAGFYHLSELVNLQQLSLWNCLRLTSHGLSTLASMSKLTELCLRGWQQLTDDSLQYLAALPNLHKLDLRACEHLRGEEMTRLSKLQHFTELNLRGCYGLNDVGMAALGSSLKHLEILSLQECWQITEAGLGMLATMTSLKELNLQGCRNLNNQLGVSLPGLDKLIPSLVSLNLKNCERLQDGALKFLQDSNKKVALESLDLSGCKELTGAALEPLAHCKALTCLRLQHCLGLRGPGALKHLAHLTSLTYIHLGGCTNLVGSAFTALESLDSSLKYLSLEGCKNVPLIERAALSIGQCSELTYLSLQGCNTMNDQALAALGCSNSLQNLQTFVASDCPELTGSGFSSWDSMNSSLTSLQLQGCFAFDDIGAKAVAQQLKGLKELNLKNCRSLTDVGIERLTTSLSQLTSLSIQGMVGLTDAGVATISSLKNLEALELQFCWQFGDQGLAALTSLAALTRLDLMYSWKITDESLYKLSSSMTSLVSLNVLGCHRLTSNGKEAVAHLLDSVIRGATH